MVKNSLQTFFGLKDHEIGKNVIFSCFDQKRLIERSFKKHIVKYFKRYYSGISLIIDDSLINVIFTGPGDSRVGDAVLALKNSNCKTVIYTGATGGLGENIKVGNLFIPVKAFIGEGFSRYYHDNLKPGWFSNSIRATDNVLQKLKLYCDNHKCSDIIKWGNIFTIETIWKETESFLNEAVSNGISAIDMETSAFYTAGKQLDINFVAIHYVSDLPQEGHEVNILNKKCLKVYMKMIPFIVDFIRFFNQ
jgi:purine-nucleoside phosphorylase